MVNAPPKASTRCPFCDAADTSALTSTSAGNVYRCPDCQKTFLVPDRDPLANAPSVKNRSDAPSLLSRR